jgi:thymidylate kinase
MLEPGDSGLEAIHPALSGAFRALDEHGISWALLRGRNELRRPSGDVDLLVDAAAREVDSVVVGAGFVRLAARGHGSHRFYVTYDADRDCWIKLDVVTDVTFGFYQQFETTLAPGLLARRRRVGAVWVLSADDAFWHLLLHHLLSPEDVPERRRHELQAVAREASDRGPAGELVRTVHPRAALRLLAAARGGNWRAVGETGRVLRRAWYLKGGLGLAVLSARRRLERHLPPREGAREGVTVGILGPDGAGKTTLARALASSTALPSEYVYLGAWRPSRFDNHLRRVFGARLAVRLVTLVAKAVVIRGQRRLGRLVLLDRFTADAYLPCPNLDLKGRISARLVRRTNADPDLIILLDAPVELMYARKGEYELAALQLWRDAYRAMRNRYPQMVIVDASMPAEDVRREATRLVWQAWLGAVQPATQART